MRVPICNCDLLETIGYITVGIVAFKFILWVYRNFGVGKNSLRKYGAGKEAWAVVTGASDGIGKEFATELAKRKMNIVLVSRTAEKLKDVAKTISESYNVQVKTVPFDFSTSNPGAYNVFEELKSLDIGILVNNVGVNVEFPTMFHEHTQAEFENMLNANIRSVHQMTSIFIEKLSSRKGAAIVNVSSQSATLVAPMLSVYAGTKGYLIAFSKALAAEYKPKGVDVVCITPSMVVSNMSKRRAGWDCPKPPAVVKPTLDSLGSGNVVFSPYIGHQLIDFVADLLPASLLSSQVLKLHQSVRIRAIKKKERTASEGKK